MGCVAAGFVIILEDVLCRMSCSKGASCLR